MKLFGNPIERKIQRRIKWLRKKGCDKGGCPATLSCTRTAKALDFCARYQLGLDPIPNMEVIAK